MKQPLHSREAVISAIRAAARRLGRAPTRGEFTRMSGISHFRVLAHFPSLRAAIREAGLTPNPQGLRIATADLLRDWAAVAKKLGCVPSRSQYLRHGRYSAGVFTLRFGSWRGVAETFVRFVEENELGEEWGDVMKVVKATGTLVRARPPSPMPGNFHNAYSLDAALKRRAQARVPVPHEYGGVESGAAVCLPPPLLKQRCITQEIVVMIVNTLAPEGDCDGGMEPAKAESLGGDWPASWPVVSRPLYRDRPVMGVPLAIPGLAYEPVNETGVVFLFGMLADRLRFRVECLQASFPDCEATREIQPGRWQRVRIEFEFESRNFQTHRHPAEGCDVIVCWKHNWPECELEVVELRKAVMNLVIG